MNYLVKKKIKKPIYEIDTTNLNIESGAKTLNDIIFAKIDAKNYYLGKIDWLAKLFQEDRLVEFFD